MSNAKKDTQKHTKTI